MNTPHNKQIHAQAPRRLASLYKELGFNQRAVSRKLDVNPAYVYNALIKGIRPSNDVIAKKLLFSKRKKKFNPLPRIVKHKPEWLRTWEKTPKSKKHKLIKGLILGELIIVKKESK